MRRWISAAKTRYRSASTAIRSPNEWTFSVSSKRIWSSARTVTRPGGGPVCDVAQDGASTLITRGVLNLTHRDGHRRPEPLEPDRRYRVRFPLHAIGYSIQPDTGCALRSHRPAGQLSGRPRNPYG